MVIDVSNSPSFEDDAVMEFFTTSTRNILAAEQAAGVGHHVAHVDRRAAIASPTAATCAPRSRRRS